MRLPNARERKDILLADYDTVSIIKGRLALLGSSCTAKAP